MVKYEHSRTQKNMHELLDRKMMNVARLEIYSRLSKIHGYDEIADILRKMAEQDIEHALIIMQGLKDNLQTSYAVRRMADEKHAMHQDFLSEFEHIAQLESIKPAQELFSELKQIEAEHEKTLLRLLQDIQAKRVFHKDSIVRWRCRRCGYIAEGLDAPKKCNVCKRPQGYFEVVKN